MAAMHEQRRPFHAVTHGLAAAAAFEAGFIGHLCSQHVKVHELWIESFDHREMIVLFSIIDGQGGL